MLTIGNFDGLHLGHQKLLRSSVEYARLNGCVSKVMSFSPHPHVYFDGAEDFLLIDEDFKDEEILRLGIDEHIRVPFGEVCGLEAEVFFRDWILVQDPVVVVVGVDFHFGLQARGDVKLLRSLCSMWGIVVEEVSAQGDVSGKYSSSRIRSLLKMGDVEGASKLLGRDYFLRGEVVHGEARGRQLGFPTANLGKCTQLIPRVGVYVSRFRILGELKFYRSVTAVTERIFFGGGDVVVETHVLDVPSSWDIYGCKAEVHFECWLREERKFESLEALMEAMRGDLERARGAAKF